ncbi:hypothetical protein ACVWWQ_002453 [Rhodanobacter sp. TND4EL1]
MIVQGKAWHIQDDFISSCVSPFTHHILITNLHETKFWINPKKATTSTEAIIAQCHKLWKTLNSERQPSRLLLDLTEKLAKAKTVLQYARVFDQIIDLEVLRVKPKKYHYKTASYGSPDYRRMVEFLSRLNEAGILAWPKISPWPRQNRWMEHPIRECVAEVLPLRNRSSHNLVTQIIRGCMCTVGIKNVGDLIPVTIRLPERYKGHIAKWAKIVMATQRHEYGFNPFSLDEFTRKKAPPRRDVEFHWASESNQGIEVWRKYAADFMAVQRLAKPSRVSAINIFFDYLIASHLERDPAVYLSGLASEEFSTKNPRLYNYVHEFIDWMLREHFAEEIDGSLQIKRPFRNPLSKKTIDSTNKGETHRDAIPKWLLDRIIVELTRNDYEWARNWGSSHSVGGDMFPQIDPSTGLTIWTWSPIRAFALHAKLLHPMRGFQVRMLDSGEADDLIYDLKHNALLPNVNKVRSSSGSRAQKGVLQISGDRSTGISYPCLFINTNKTADIWRDPDDRGFVSPYAPDNLLALLCKVRDWQTTFNPIEEATKWIDVKEHFLSRTESQLRGMETCFLFRDAAGRNTAHPLTDGRLNNMWAALLYRVQCEVNEELALSGAETIQLVAYDPRHGPVQPRYDLHTIRVTLITSLLENGAPIEILGKIVGHKSIVMTAYYAKFSPAYIKDVIEAAVSREALTAKESFVRDKRTMDFENASSLGCGVDGVDALRQARDGLGVVFDDDGICPVNKSRCGDGGPRMTDRLSKNLYGPVPGGQRNCASCRFRVSGPPFLIGLIATWNVKSAQAHELAGERKAAVAPYQELMQQAEAARSAGERFEGAPLLVKARAAVESIESALDAKLAELISVNRLVLESLELLKLENVDSEVRLIANDTMSLTEVQVQETTTFDLWDRVCQSAEFFTHAWSESENIRALSLRRWDWVLAKLGFKESPLFLLDDHTGIKVINELSRLMRSRLGTEEFLKFADSGILSQASCRAELKSIAVNALRDLSISNVDRRLSHEPCAKA